MIELHPTMRTVTSWITLVVTWPFLSLRWPRRRLTHPARWLAVSIASLLAGLGTSHPTIAAMQQPRATPRPFDREQVTPFFEDAFRDGLPDKPPATDSVPATAGNTPSNTELPATPGWSATVSASTLENLVKSLHQEIQKSITPPAAYAAGGWQKAQQQLAMLAIVFGVIEQYDADVRWRADATLVRSQLRPLAYRLTASPEDYREVRDTQRRLEDLIGGNRWPQPTLPAAPFTDWAEVADRTQIMNQLEFSSQQVLQPAIDNAKVWRENAQRVRRHAELTAMLAEILMQSDMEDSADESYCDECQKMKTAAQRLCDAVDDIPPTDAKSAMTEINRSCANCHDQYRG